MKRVIRVFPRKTRATPQDELTRIDVGPGLFDEADEVHISVVFTWDLKRAKELKREWEQVAETKIGGPAFGQPGAGFIPGMYVKSGYTITSRGCPNRCWFCSVWKREGDLRELEIQDGWNVLDDNLLACSDEHIQKVFDMLGRQKHQIEFTGGLEAKRLKPWHAKELKRLHTKQMFFAYDTPDDLEPLQSAGKILIDAGFTKGSHSLRCFVLFGWPRDTMKEAEKRMHQTLDAGFLPMGMLYRRKDGKRDPKWKKFNRTWARPIMICSQNRPASNLFLFS